MSTTNPHQCHSSAVPSRVYFEKSEHMSSLDQQSKQRYSCNTPIISQKISYNKNLVGGAATWIKTIPFIFQLRFCYFSKFSFKGLDIPFPGKLDFLGNLRTFLQPSFLYTGIITPVYQSFGVFPSFQTT